MAYPIDDYHPPEPLRTCHVVNADCDRPAGFRVGRAGARTAEGCAVTRDRRNPAEAAFRLAADAVTAAYGVRAALLKLRTMSARHMRMRDLAAIDAAVSAAIVRLERERRRQLARLPNPEPATSADRASLRRYFRAALARAARAEWERSG